MKEEISKYYTPSLDEFHFGFECEMTGHEMPPQWHKHIVNINTFNEWLFKGNPKIGAAFRVKYLDKEDIESLGFKIEVQKDGRIIAAKKKLIGNIEVGHWIIEYVPSTKKIQIETISVYNEHIYWVQGVKIKNKSELKVLLKQLDVNE